MNPTEFQQRFFDDLGRPFGGEEIFDAVPDTLFFIKDREGRYVSVNETVVERCGKASKDEIIGKTTSEVFPAPLGEDYLAQDLEIVQGSPAINRKLELHLHPNGQTGWCLTWKQAIRDARGDIVGLSGISRDVGPTTEIPRDLPDVARALDHLRDHLDQPLHLADLAKVAGLSSYQLDQRIRALFGISAAQHLARCRIEAACHLLTTSDQALVDIALSTGFSDQSSFTRHFKKSVGITPKAYRVMKS
ncbi:MAG: AraC family transcriptional regulator [Verrucomicrobiota bacterium JB023]|nr:AraC family transcriptional regulator [Verrucomicrobiota bacterium JB023]